MEALSIGQTRTLKNPIGFRGKVWVPAGEQVKIISISGNAVIIETAKKFKFPCNIKDIE